MAQMTVSVVKTEAGLVIVDVSQEAGYIYHIRNANDVAEVLPNREFKLLLSNLGTEERRFPKGMVVALASKNPLTLVRIGGEEGGEVARCLKIGGYNG